ncbi:MAG: hypothetical protein ACYTFM_04455 [Planctomycetota bacterium]
MKAIRKIVRTYYIRHIVACFLAAYMLLGIPVRIALANPNPASDARCSQWSSDRMEYI